MPSTTQAASRQRWRPGSSAKRLPRSGIRVIPVAIPLLTRVVNGASGEGSELEKQQVMDVRIAAALALAQFHDPRVTDSLIRVLEKDKDVALCDCAFESLEKSIGRQLPPDFHNWDELRHSPDAKLAAQPYLNPGDIGLKLMGWFGQR